VAVFQVNPVKPRSTQFPLVFLRPSVPKENLWRQLATGFNRPDEGNVLIPKMENHALASFFLHPRGRSRIWEGGGHQGVWMDWDPGAKPQ